MKKPIEIWHLFSKEVKVALIAGVFAMIGALIGSGLNPQAGRYVLVKNDNTDYDIFDTATGRVYYWGGVNGLKAIDDPVNNKLINVIKRKNSVYLPK